MTEAIVSHEPKVTVPEYVMLAFSRAIRLRRKETGFVKSYGASTEKSQQGHSTHMHFTENVLGKVHDLLRPLASQYASQNSPAVGVAVEVTDEPTFSISNKLTSLSVADQQELVVDAANLSPDLLSVDVEFGDAEIEGEFFLAIEVFMEDVWFLRQYIQQTWEMYWSSYLENTVCSLFTNTAIDLIRLAEKTWLAW